MPLTFELYGLQRSTPGAERPNRTMHLLAFITPVALATRTRVWIRPMQYACLLSVAGVYRRAQDPGLRPASEDAEISQTPV